MKISQVIITYNPDIDKLRDVIESTISQLDFIYIVDNGSLNVSEVEEICDEFLNKNKNESEKKIATIKLIKNKSNIGIAAATNIGIKEALTQNFDYLLLSDQDTIYTDGYVSKALELIGNSKNCIAVTPVVLDQTTNTRKPVYVKRCGFVKKVQLHGSCSVFQAISSGMFINLHYMNDELLMNEDLFIDYVDFEWCWKVIKHGYRIFADESLVINHALGDKEGVIAGKKVSLRSNIRYYYIVRNTMYLALYCPYIGLRIKMQLFIKVFQYLFGYTFLDKEKMKTFKLLLNAVRNGIKNKLGRKE